MNICKLINLILVVLKMMVSSVVADVASEVVFQPYGYRMCRLYSCQLVLDFRFDDLHLQCDVRATCDGLTKRIVPEKICGHKNCSMGERWLDTRTKGRLCVERILKNSKSQLCLGRTEVQTNASCNNSRIKQATVVFPPPSSSPREAIKKRHQSRPAAPLHFSLDELQYTVSSKPTRISSDITLWSFTVKIDTHQENAALSFTFCLSKHGASTTCNQASTCFASVNKFVGSFIEVSTHTDSANLEAHMRIAEVEVTICLGLRGSVVVTFRLGKQVERLRFRCAIQREVWVEMEGRLVEWTPIVVTDKVLCEMSKEMP